jgi:hypothetical protein
MTLKAKSPARYLSIVVEAKNVLNHMPDAARNHVPIASPEQGDNREDAYKESDASKGHDDRAPSVNTVYLSFEYLPLRKRDFDGMALLPAGSPPLG